MDWRIAESLKKLRAQINADFPTRDKKSDGSIGDTAHAARKSDHNPNDAGVVTAIDITHDPKTLDCNLLADVLFKSKDARIKYLIWKRKITVPGLTGWKKYTGANAHAHHLHVSVSSDPRLYDSKKEWDLSELIDDIAKVSAAAPSSSTSTGSLTDKPAAASVSENSSINEPPPNQNEDLATETTEKQTVQTPNKEVSTEVTAKNQQDVTKPADVTEPEPYNKIGFWATIKADLAKVGFGNLGTQSLSEYAQQSQYIPQWAVPIIAKVATVALVFGVGYLLFRVVHYVIDTLKKNKRVELETLAKTDINRRDVNWTKE